MPITTRIMSEDAEQKEHVKKGLDYVLGKTKQLDRSTPEIESKSTNLESVDQTCIFFKAQPPSPLKWCFYGMEKEKNLERLVKRSLKRDFENKWKERKGETSDRHLMPPLTPTLFLTSLTPNPKGIYLPSCKAQHTTQDPEKRRKEGERAPQNLLQSLRWSKAFVIPTQNEL